MARCALWKPHCSGQMKAQNTHRHHQPVGLRVKLAWFWGACHPRQRLLAQDCLLVSKSAQSIMPSDHTSVSSHCCQTTGLIPGYNVLTPAVCNSL